MKRVAIIIVALALVSPVLAWMFIDGRTAVFFLMASGLVCVSAGMPVLFSVVTRRSRHHVSDVRDEQVIQRPTANHRTP